MGLFEDGAAVCEGGANLGGEVGLCIGIVFPVHIREVGVEAGGV